MATTVHYRNAVLLIGGGDISGQVSELAINYTCEILDGTAMGDTVRGHRAGLLNAQATGKVWYQSGVGLAESFFYPFVGTDDTVITIYPNGIVEGSQAAGSGYAFRGVVNQFNIGGAVGTLLPINFAFEGRGIGV